jgi:hypothetical protein
MCAFPQQFLHTGIVEENYNDFVGPTGGEFSRRCRVSDFPAAGPEEMRHRLAWRKTADPFEARLYVHDERRESWA